MQKKNLFSIIWLIVFAFFHISLFIAAGFTGHTAVFWLTYIFALLAFFVVAGSAALLGKSGMQIRDWLFGYPIIRHCIIYCILELVCSVIFFALENVVPWQLAFILQLALLAFYSVLAISCIISKKTIDEVHTKVTRNTQFVQLLRVDADMVVKKCTDPDARKTFADFSEKVRYSDPVSCDAVAKLESKLSDAVAQMGEKLESGLITEAQDLCREAGLLLDERNLKVKAMKGR